MSEPLIEIEDVSIIRDGSTLLNRVRLSIKRGEHVAILGPNGCGKSTLIRLLTREIYPYGGQGTVRVLGEESWVIRDLRKVIGVVSNEPREPLLGDPSVLDLTVSGLLGTYGVTWGYDVSETMLESARCVIQEVGLSGLELRKVDTLSAGETRRAFIARALISDPIALVLDEPTTALDIKARRQFVELMRSLAGSGRSLILVTHHFEEVIEDFERILFMRHGAIVKDDLRSKIFNNRELSDLFETEVQLPA